MIHMGRLVSPSDLRIESDWFVRYAKNRGNASATRRFRFGREPTPNYCLMNPSPLLSNLKSPASRRSRRLWWVVIAFVVYTITGFFILPPIIKSQLVKRLPGLTHRQAAVRQVKVNPYTLSLTIRGLSLAETNGEPFAGFDEFYADFRLSSLFRWAWTFGEIRLVHPTANIVRAADGQFNFANLFTPAPPPETAKKPKSLPVVLVQHLVITNGDLSFVDRTRAAPLNIDYGPVNLDLKNFTTRRNRDGRYSLAVTAGTGGNFAWSGTVSANPPQSAGQFALHGFALKTYSPYLADFARAEIADGVVDVDAQYRLSAETGPLELDATNVSVKLADFRLKAPDTGEALLTLDDAVVSGASASLAGRKARVPLIAVNGGSMLVRREHDGQLNWLKLLVAQTNGAATASAETNLSSGAPPAWQAALDELDLRGFTVSAEDQVPGTAAHIGLDDLRVNVKGISTQSNAPVTAVVDFNWRGGGTVHVEAAGSILPPAGGAKLAITNLALPPLQPYVEQQARLVVSAGGLTVNGQARYAPGASNAPLAQFAGDVSITNFDSMDTVAYHDFAKWDNLGVRGIQFSFQTNSLIVEEVKFTGLEPSLVINSNGLPNVQALLNQKPAAQSNGMLNTAASPAPSAIELFPVKVAALVFEKCSFRAADQSLTPHFDTSIEEFNGTIRDLMLPGINRARVDIRGRVSGLAPFEVTGSITPDPKNPFVDLKLTMKNDDLTPFTPYTEKFAGYPLNKGKLAFDLNYKIENRKLQGSNAIVIDQFTFGPRNDSPNATKLPVRLAVALLKDRNGQIDLNLPVSGSLDDPKFSIGGLVWKAVENILLKVATSPFSLLGAMFGGGEELQYVDFAPGAIALDPAQTNKLDILVKALYERPALNLEISASIDSADREIVSRRKLRDRMKLLRMQELARRGKTVPTLEQFQIEPSDYERLLRRSYRETFNMEPERVLREAREAAAAANPGASSTAAFGTFPPTETTKGATQLMQTPSFAPAPNATPPRAPGSSASPAKLKIAQDPVLEEMEQRLASVSPASGDDLRELIRQRCGSVQKYLLETGKVTAERIFLIAPKPADFTVNSQARATFSLD